MATQNNFTRSFPVTASLALSAFRRVTMTSTGSLAYSTNLEVGCGVLQQDVQGAYWENPQVRLYSAGTSIISATGGVITMGVTVYATANGQIAASGTITIGTALTSAVNGGDIIEVLTQF